MDNKELKLRAKQTIRESKPNAVSVGLLYVGIALLLGALSTKLTGIDMSESQAEKFYNFYLAGDFESAFTYVQKFMPSVPAFGIDTLISLVKLIIDGGFLIYILNAIRKSEDAGYGNLFDGFAVPFKLIFLAIIKAIIIGLGFLLLIVPGIIFAYMFRQSTFLLLDHHEWGIFKCLSESSRIMKGNKWKLFTLDLSFIGWYLLGIIPVVDIWVQPYTKMTYGLFYEEINGRVEIVDI